MRERVPATPPLLGPLLLGAYLVVTSLLAVEGLYYLRAVLRSRRPAPAPAPSAAVLAPDALPLVTVQVPVKDEGGVLAHALDAIAALDWPRERLEAQVIDDSGPEGWRASEALVEGLRERGVRVEHFRGRPAAHKAGALQEGLERARGSVLLLLDADFAPPPSFLRETVPRLLSDPRVACVHARWSTRNANEGWVARATALALDAHFVVEQRARAHDGALLSFIGTATVWRREAIEEAGGWSGRTLAEDVDLGTLALRRGWRLAFVEAPQVPQEAPATVAAFRTQQARWARGSMQCARLHAAPVLREARLPWRVRGETFFHLTHYVVHPLLLALFLLQLARPWTSPPPLLAAGATLALAVAGALAFFGATLARSGDARRWRDLPGLALLGLGVCWSNSVAVARGLGGPRGAFARTPKGRAAGGTRWRPRPAELLLGLAGAAGAVALGLAGHALPAAGAGAYAAAFLLVALHP